MSTKTSNFLVFSHVAKAFASQPVLTDVNLTIAEGESHVLLGGSGSGKSVLLKCLLGLLDLDGGSIMIGGKPRIKSSVGLSMLFQGGALFDSLTVIENIMFPLRYGPNRKEKWTKSSMHDRAIQCLKDVELGSDVANLFPADLSGGMQKRVGLARSIVTSPSLILFDEPTTGLDPITSNVINDLIARTLARRATTGLTITHDINSALRIANRISLLHDGKIVWTGSKSELTETKNPLVYQFVHGLTTGPFYA